MDKNKKPGIRIDSIILAEISFKRLPEIPASPRFHFNIDTKSSISNDKRTLQETVSVTVESNPDKSISALCVVVGQFTCECDDTNMSLDEFSKANAPAIIYPYCREVLASVSVQSGMPAIILPVINFQLMAKQPKEKDAMPDPA